MVNSKMNIDYKSETKLWIEEINFLFSINIYFEEKNKLTI